MSQKTIVVTCRAHDGYRRAGVGFAKGKNEFEATAFTDAQLQAINADPRLVLSIEEAAPASLPGAGDTSTVGLAQTQGSVGAANSADGVTTTELTGTIGGVVTQDGEQKSLADMTVPELKELAESLEIVGFKSMNKPDLVAAIAAVQVQVPADAQNDATSDTATALTTEQGA